MNNPAAAYDFNSTAPQARVRFVAVGDSFTEGVGDELPDGSVRGWADLVAQGIANDLGESIQYANFAIRGRKIKDIIDEQIEPALALQPTIMTFNGGGNDMLRPKTDVPWIITRTREVMQRIRDAAVEPVLLAGADPTIGIPQGSKVRLKGDELTAAAQDLAAEMQLKFCDNWSDVVLKRRGYWSHDRLHLAEVGHHRVAANVLKSLGYQVPASWNINAPEVSKPSRREQLRYTKEHVLPWLKRRLTGKSSGDGRDFKYPDWVWVHPTNTAN